MSDANLDPHVDNLRTALKRRHDELDVEVTAWDLGVNAGIQIVIHGETLPGVLGAAQKVLCVTPDGTDPLAELREQIRSLIVAHDGFAGACRRQGDTDGAATHEAAAAELHSLIAGTDYEL